MRVSPHLALLLPLVAFLHPVVGSAQTPQTSPPPATTIPTPSIAPGSAQEARTFGKWRVVCAEADVCRLSQSIVGVTSKTPVLVARAYRPAKDPILVLSFPLGVFLAPGVAIGIDGTKPDRLPYETCDIAGCHLGVKLTAKMLTKLRRAKNLAVTVYDGAQTPVALKLDLDGFVSGLGELQK